MVGSLAETTGFHAPVGELQVDADGEHVQCHLCGRWYRHLGGAHLRGKHKISADEYRELVGLRPRHPLWAPASSASQAKRFVRRRSTDARIAEGTRKGAALARTGELQRQAKQYLAVRPKSIERERQLERQGAALGNARAARFLERREGRARDLGFPNLRAYYRQRYVTDRLRLADVTRELACAESAVRADLSRLGLGPDRTRSHGARWAVSR